MEPVSHIHWSEESHLLTDRTLQSRGSGLSGMYYIPFSVSIECESLLKKFVTLRNKTGTEELIVKFHGGLRLVRMKIKAYMEPLGP